jgi:hypothetical protein
MVNDFDVNGTLIVAGLDRGATSSRSRDSLGVLDHERADLRGVRQTTEPRVSYDPHSCSHQPPTIPI